MDRDFYLDLAAAGARVPIGTDLVLREKADHGAIVLEGRRLGRLIEEAAARYRTPLAFHLMDLMVEKEMLLEMLGLRGADADIYHFPGCPTDAMFDTLEQNINHPLTPRLLANIEAVGYVARQTRLLPIGMSIGPFSLATKLLSDPITPVYLAGAGSRAEDDEEVRTLERTLELAMRVVLRSIEEQIRVGAKAILIAEPAANKAYFSPNQLNPGGGDVFDRYAMTANRRIKALLDKHGVDLIFHCCGELTDEMVRRFASLDPAMLSLGSSRRLWEDAALVSSRTVLYGNLPTKKFFSDESITTERVREMSGELLGHMRRIGHPFVLGSECDVLSVPGCEHTIRTKVDAMLTCAG